MFLSKLFSKFQRLIVEMIHNINRLLGIEIQTDTPLVGILARKKRNDFRSKIRASLECKVKRERVGRKDPFPLPRYDEVYFEGLEWLDSLTGSNVHEWLQASMKEADKSQNERIL